MSRAESLDLIAKAINASVDIPFVPEYLEDVGFRWLLSRLDESLPDRLVEIMVSVSDGLSDAEIAVAQQFVEKMLLQRLPGVLADISMIQTVVHRISEAMATLLRPGNSAAGGS